MVMDYFEQYPIDNAFKSMYLKFDINESNMTI